MSRRSTIPAEWADLARKAAAFDDLLAAYESTVVAMNCTDSTFMQEEADKARAAIAKAKGGQQ